MSETTLKNKVIRMIRKEFPDIWFYKTNDQFTSGIPDLILCIDGHFGGIELKYGNNTPTKLQQYFIDRINACGGRAIVARSVDEVRKFLERG